MAVRTGIEAARMVEPRENLDNSQVSLAYVDAQGIPTWLKWRRRPRGE